MAGAPDFKATRSRDDSTAEERRDFKLAVLALDGRCLVHDDLGDCSGPLQAHHCLTQQQLRRRGFADRLWTPENGMTICERAHARHTKAVERIERSRVPERCVVFAEDLGLGYLLDQFYSQPFTSPRGF